MKVIYTGIRKDTYDSGRRGFSFEYNNFFLTLKAMKEVEVVEYPYDCILEQGRGRWNSNLLELVKRERPSLLFAFPYTDELQFPTLDAIRNYTTTLAWFADDHWRLWNYSRFLAPHFSWVVTTWSKAPEIYARYGICNVIRSQWACNPRVWHPLPNAPKDIETGFIGQRNSAREGIVRALRAAGIPVRARGLGWPEGRLSEEELIESISRTRVNLNFNNPPDRWRLRLFARLFFRRSVTRIVPDVLRIADNFRSWRAMAIPQIKARPFELAGCGAFVISGYADDICRYYEEGKEMVFYRSIHELVEKVHYYLAHDEERERIARAGYHRTLRDHAYEARFREIFGEIGLLSKQ